MTPKIHSNQIKKFKLKLENKIHYLAKFYISKVHFETSLDENK